MLTLLDALSLGGDRARQNDDALGWSGSRAFVVDGATDLHDAPLMGAASDAAWIARRLAALLLAEDLTPDPRDALRAAAGVVAEEWSAAVAGRAPPRWQLPTAAALIAQPCPEGVDIVDLGDCRLFWRDATGAGGGAGGNARYRADEAASVAAHAAPYTGAPRYKTPAALELLRRQREAQNVGYAIFNVEADCTAKVRVQRLALTRPAHLLLATDGFAALADDYGAYDPAGLVVAAVDRGLAALGVELRAIEAADQTGARFPRWKRSDDATALLLRLD